MVKMLLFFPDSFVIPQNHNVICLDYVLQRWTYNFISLILDRKNYMNKQPLNEKNNMNPRIKHGLINVHLLPIKMKINNRYIKDVFYKWP